MIKYKYKLSKNLPIVRGSQGKIITKLKDYTDKDLYIWATDKNTASLIFKKKIREIIKGYENVPFNITVPYKYIFPEGNK